MNRLLALLAVCSGLMLTACAEMSADAADRTAAKMNSMAEEQFRIGIGPLSYLISGPRVIRLEKNMSLKIQLEDAPIQELVAAGYFSITTDSTTGATWIERTSEGDRIHDLFAQRSAP